MRSALSPDRRPTVPGVRWSSLKRRSTTCRPKSPRIFWNGCSPRAPGTPSSLPVQMKKGRPGLTVTALADFGRRDAVTATLFRESTTLGVRITVAERETLERRVVRVETPWGRVGVKVGLRDGTVINRAPEFEDCRRLAESSGVALKEIHREALAASLPDSGNPTEDGDSPDSPESAAPDGSR